MPLLASLPIVAIATYAALPLQGSGFRPVEILIGGLVDAIVASYLCELVIAPPHWRALAVGVLVPRHEETGSVTLAVAIVRARSCRTRFTCIRARPKRAFLLPTRGSGGTPSASRSARYGWRSASPASSISQ
jgi:hypothetical protein